MSSDVLTWTCHVCGDVRPDAAIAVYRTTYRLGRVELDHNVRYCVDRPACVEAARSIRWLGPEWGRPV